jgi:DNA-binding NarL/FixJ family response regulator
MRVLVCDDHSLFREGLRLLLEKLDPSMEVTLTGSAEDAVAALKAALPTFTMTDAVKPDAKMIYLEET